MRDLQVRTWGSIPGSGACKFCKFISVIMGTALHTSVTKMLLSTLANPLVTFHHPRANVRTGSASVYRESCVGSYSPSTVVNTMGSNLASVLTQPAEETPAVTAPDRSTPGSLIFACWIPSFVSSVLPESVSWHEVLHKRQLLWFSGSILSSNRGTWM